MGAPRSEAQLAVVAEHTAAHDGVLASERRPAGVHRFDNAVFRVSGTIALESAIRVSAPYLTVAGQPSPGGVQIKGNANPEGDWGVWFVNGAHDIIVRHLRVRMGGNLKHDAGNNTETT